MPSKVVKALEHRTEYAYNLIVYDTEPLEGVKKAVLVHLKSWLKQDDWLFNSVADVVEPYIRDAVGLKPEDKIPKTVQSRINATTDLLIRQLKDWILEGADHELHFGDLDVVEKEMMSGKK